MKFPLLTASAARAGALALAARPAATQAPAGPRSRTFVLISIATVSVPPASTEVLDLWLSVPHADASQDVARTYEFSDVRAQ